MTSFSYKAIVGNGKTGALPINETDDWGFGIKNITPVKRSAIPKKKTYVDTNKIIIDSQEHFNKNSKHEYIQQYQRGVNPAVKTVYPSLKSGTLNMYRKVDNDKILQDHVALPGDLYGRKSREKTYAMNPLNKSSQRPSFNNNVKGKLRTQMRNITNQTFEGYKNVSLQPKFISKYQPKSATHKNILVTNAKTNKKFIEKMGNINTTHITGLHKDIFNINVNNNKKFIEKMGNINTNHITGLHKNLLNINVNNNKKFLPKDIKVSSISFKVKNNLQPKNVLTSKTYIKKFSLPSKKIFEKITSKKIKTIMYQNNKNNVMNKNIKIHSSKNNISSIHQDNIKIKNAYSAKTYIPKNIQFEKILSRVRNINNISAETFKSKRLKNNILQSNKQYTIKQTTTTIPQMYYNGKQQGQFKNTKQTKVVKFNLKPSFVTTNYVMPTVGEQADMPAPIFQ
jgi:hypothetical protein